MFLVPYADMLNHKKSSEPCLQKYYDEKRKGFAIKALNDIPKGSEICYDYGPNLSSFNFFCTYGFIPDPCPLHWMPFVISLDPKDPNVEEKRKYLTERH